MPTTLKSTGVTFPDGSTQTTALDASGVSAGSYGSASAIPTLTINANGIITAASTASVSVPANCSNCSSYTNLTDKPTIPANCDNGVAGTATSQCTNYGGSVHQCTYPIGVPYNSQCVSSNYNALLTAGSRRTNGAAYLYTEKTGSSIRLRQVGLKGNCNCDCNC